MHILMTGGTGFIGRHIAARLLRAGHMLTLASRDAASARRRFPEARIITVDMQQMTAPADWLPLLAGVDGVINCAGILQSGRRESAELVHLAAPKALFDACAAVGVRRAVQISAVSADTEAGTEYAITKKAADDHLRRLDLDWVVLRPSLVYAQGSFGGTSLLRGLAGFPFFIPLPGEGSQKFQPIHAEDIAETVLRCLENPSLARRTFDPVGPDTLSLKAILMHLRSWLDLPAAPLLPLPMLFIRLAARIGDFAGAGPIRSTSIAQMNHGNVSDPAAFETAIGFRPRSMAEALQQWPSHVQDRWHARLYFLRPILTLALAILWLGSGIAGLLNSVPQADEALAGLAVPAVLRPAIFDAFCLLDIAIGFALLIGWNARVVGLLQIVLVAVYTLGLGILAPSLWTEPYAPLLKNLPIAASVAAWMAVQDEK